MHEFPHWFHCIHSRPSRNLHPAACSELILIISSFLKLPVPFPCLRYIVQTHHGPQGCVCGLASPSLQPHLARVNLPFLGPSAIWLCNRLCSALPSHKGPGKRSLLPVFLSLYSWILRFRYYCQQILSKSWTSMTPPLVFFLPPWFFLFISLWASFLLPLYLRGLPPVPGSPAALPPPILNTQTFPWLSKHGIN